jgi:hypothetical protein
VSQYTHIKELVFTSLTSCTSSGMNEAGVTTCRLRPHAVEWRNLFLRLLSLILSGTMFYTRVCLHRYACGVGVSMRATVPCDGTRAVYAGLVVAGPKSFSAHRSRKTTGVPAEIHTSETARVMLIGVVPRLSSNAPTAPLAIFFPYICQLSSASPWATTRPWNPSAS